MPNFKTMLVGTVVTTLVQTVLSVLISVAIIGFSWQMIPNGLIVFGVITAVSVGVLCLIGKSVLDTQALGLASACTLVLVYGAMHWLGFNDGALWGAVVVAAFGYAGGALGSVATKLVLKTA